MERSGAEWRAAARLRAVAPSVSARPHRTPTSAATADTRCAASAHAGGGLARHKGYTLDSYGPLCVHRPATSHPWRVGARKKATLGAGYLAMRCGSASVLQRGGGWCAAGGCLVCAAQSRQRRKGGTAQVLLDPVTLPCNGNNFDKASLDKHAEANPNGETCPMCCTTLPATLFAVGVGIEFGL